MKLAIFDFDGTLLRGNSYHLFFWWVLRDRPVQAPMILFCLLLRRLRLVPARFLKNRTLAIMRGLTGAEVSALGHRLYAGLLASRLRPAGLHEIAARRADGCKIVLLTGAFDFLVAPFAEEQAIATWCATVVAFCGGRCEGAIDGVELMGEEKLRALERLFAGQKVDWAASWAYGDEESDLSLLARVGHPVWVKSHRLAPRGLSPACNLVEWDACPK